MNTPGPHTASSALQRGRNLARHFAADATGAVAVIVALTFPLLIGGMGLGTEAGLWYLTERKLQNASDLAAHGAAKQLAAGKDDAAMLQMAEYLAQQAEINLASATVQVNNPPSSGAYAGNDGAVEAIVARELPRMFTAIFDSDPVPIAARAVALVQLAGTGCVLALGSSDGAITVSGSSVSSLTLCDMVSNAPGTAFVMAGGGASVSANCIQTVGTAQTTGNLTVACDKLRENASAVSDPFAGVDEPAMTGQCQSGSVGKSNTTTTVTPTDAHASGMSSRLYCTGQELSGTVVLQPGLYMIKGGDFRINSNANILGDGVVFYLANGVNLKFNGSAKVDLSAPTSGEYAGILIFGSRGHTTGAHVINGNLGSILDGAIYAPTANLTISGSAKTSANGCTQIVTGTVNFAGGGNIDISCVDPAGAAIEIAGGVALVE